MNFSLDPSINFFIDRYPILQCCSQLMRQLGRQFLDRLLPGCQKALVDRIVVDHHVDEAAAQVCVHEA